VKQNYDKHVEQMENWKDIIIKQLIVDGFGVCAKGYVEEPKRQVSKSLEIQALQSCRLAPINYFVDQWNAKNLGVPYFVK
jgi:hypothetical protein